MKDDFLHVVDPVIGHLYHVSWAESMGVVGKCIFINKYAKTVTLETPRSKRLFNRPVAISDLRHTRKNETKIKIRGHE